MSIACVSGYFDPIHIGHIEYFKKSKNIADKLMVIVNNDEQAILHLCTIKSPILGRFTSAKATVTMRILNAQRCKKRQSIHAGR